MLLLSHVTRRTTPVLSLPTISLVLSHWIPRDSQRQHGASEVTGLYFKQVRPAFPSSQQLTAVGEKRDSSSVVGGRQGGMEGEAGGHGSSWVTELVSMPHLHVVRLPESLAADLSCFRAVELSGIRFLCGTFLCYRCGCLWRSPSMSHFGLYPHYIWYLPVIIFYEATTHPFSDLAIIFFFFFISPYR